MGIAGILNDLLSGGAGQVGGSMQQMIHADTERGANALRARFGAGGGTAFGTPGAYAESLYRAEAAPRATQAVAGLQLQALFPIMQMMAALAGRGISQRETIAQPNPVVSGLTALAGGLQAAGGMANTFSGLGSMGGGGMPMPQVDMTALDQYFTQNIPVIRP